MRAQSKTNYSIFWNPGSPEQFRSGSHIAKLLDDLCLDQEKDLDGCKAMLDAVTATIGEYRQAIRFVRQLPGLASQLAELKALTPALKAAHEKISTLSFLTRQRLKNAHAEAGRVNHTLARQLEQAIDCAHSDLVLLTIASEQAATNLTQYERRGRPSNRVHILIKQLAEMFDRYDQGDHDDAASRSAARIAFIRHVLSAFRITAPKRLSSIVSLK